jgi:hypothetical protein
MEDKIRLKTGEKVIVLYKDKDIVYNYRVATILNRLYSTEEDESEPYTIMDNDGVETIVFFPESNGEEYIIPIDHFVLMLCFEGYLHPEKKDDIREILRYLIQIIDCPKKDGRSI